MHHDMLDAGKFPFDAVVYPLGDRVGIGKAQFPVKADLQIHIHAAAELPGLETVDAENRPLLKHAVGKALLGLRVAGVIHHLGCGIAENIIGSLEDKKRVYQYMASLAAMETTAARRARSPGVVCAALPARMVSTAL